MNGLKDGEIFCGCEILCRCGRGAYGVTYLAKNPIGQKIIIKTVLLTPSSARELNGLRNYMNISGTHPNLLQIFHIGELDDCFYYTMEAADALEPDSEYIPATLGNLLRRGKVFTPEEAIAVIKQLVGGVKAIHEAKLIHRDIKPDNIIFVNGIAKLSDPGLVIEEGEDPTFAGTPGFIPPEMLEDPLPPSCSGDLYALGKVFYCMVTGFSARQFPLLPEDMSVEVCRQLLPILCKMCDRNPRRRFQTIHEFSAGLPEKLNAPGRIDILRRELRNWKILNPVLYRILFSGAVLLFILLTVGASLLFYHHRMTLRKEMIRKQNVTAFSATFRKHRELLALQLESALPRQLPAMRKLQASLASAIDKKEWHTAEKNADQLKTLLQSAAEKLRPAIPEKNGDLKRDFSISGAAHSFLATPLSFYLETAEYRKRLKKYDRSFLSSWSGPRCGQDWDNFQYSNFPMAFVPAGAVKMAHNGKIKTIPYHFWMCKNEATHEHFTRITRIAPQKSPHPNTPVERVSWNDVLLYCRQMTEIMQSHGVLPPGYIVRPPTEEEWEFASVNGWLGKDEIPLEERAVFRKNSGNRSWPPGSKKASKLGLFDIFGNVYEQVLPSGKPPMQHSVIIRGGSYRSDLKSCSRRIPYLAYQAIPFDIGFRTVIAPGDMDFFERHFFHGGPVQTRRKGKVYELIGANIGSFDWDIADKMAKLLGGRLAEIEDQETLSHIIRELPLAASSWGCFLGGVKIDGKWQWRSSGKIIDYGKWQPPRHSNAKYLTLRSKKWQGVKNFRTGIFLCEWDEKNYASRNAQLAGGKKLPLALARFSVGDREFMLIKSSILFYSAARVCELLGGRLAVLDSEDMRREVIKKLHKFRQNPVLLGGYAKWDKWYWLNGKEIDLPLENHKDILTPSLNRNFLVLQNGRFFNSQFSSMFLCQWRKSSASPN